LIGIFGAMANAAVGETSIRVGVVADVGMYAVLCYLINIAKNIKNRNFLPMRSEWRRCVSLLCWLKTETLKLHIDYEQ
jgi:hypothetical protein